MRLAFALFKYFPFGGLQRDFLRIAKECASRGHDINIYTMSWQGEIPEGMSVKIIASHGLTNHARAEDFTNKFLQRLANEKYQMVVGFNKMPGLDIYYAADSCFSAKAKTEHSWLYRITNRYRRYYALEQAVFKKDSQTKILILSPQAQYQYIQYYDTDPSRFELLPPGISLDRLPNENSKEVRKQLRQQLHIPDHHHLLLMIGSGFRTKGVDRSIRALQALPKSLREQCTLFIIGDDNAKPFIRLAKRLGVVDQVKFLGGCYDVPDYLQAADLLLHPAYYENTGTVLIEAIIAGLPVLASSECGYADHITKAEAGLLVAAPFVQQQFNQLLQMMLLSNKRGDWRNNGLAYGHSMDLYSMPQKAADLIESVGQGEGP